MPRHASDVFSFAPADIGIFRWILYTIAPRLHVIATSPMGGTRFFVGFWGEITIGFSVSLTVAYSNVVNPRLVPGLDPCFENLNPLSRHIVRFTMAWKDCFIIFPTACIVSVLGQLSCWPISPTFEHKSELIPLHVGLPSSRCFSCLYRSCFLFHGPITMKRPMFGQH
jgi:hypothetical protein